MTGLLNGYRQSKRKLFILAFLHNLILTLNHKTCNIQPIFYQALYDFSTHFIPTNISFSKLPQAMNSSWVCWAWFSHVFVKSAWQAALPLFLLPNLPPDTQAHVHTQSLLLEGRRVFNKLLWNRHVKPDIQEKYQLCPQPYRISTEIQIPDLIKCNWFVLINIQMVHD